MKLHLHAKSDISDSQQYLLNMSERELRRYSYFYITKLSAAKPRVYTKGRVLCNLEYTGILEIKSLFRNSYKWHRCESNFTICRLKLRLKSLKTFNKLKLIPFWNQLTYWVNLQNSKVSVLNEKNGKNEAIYK